MFKTFLKKYELFIEFVGMFNLLLGLENQINKTKNKKKNVKIPPNLPKHLPGIIKHMGISYAKQPIVVNNHHFS